MSFLIIASQKNYWNFKMRFLILPVSFQWIHYYSSNKSTGLEIGKLHLCILLRFIQIWINFLHADVKKKDFEAKKTFLFRFIWYNRFTVIPPFFIFPWIYASCADGGVSKSNCKTTLAQCSPLWLDFQDFVQKQWGSLRKVANINICF